MEQRIAWLIILLVVVVIASRHWRYQAKLNHIVLRDSYTSVQDSMLKLNSLLERFPADPKSFSNYKYVNSDTVMEDNIVNDSLLFINGYKVDKTTLGTAQVLSVYTLSERQTIVKLCEYLKANHLWGASSGGNGTGLWAYSYRGSFGRDIDDDRSLIALKNLSDTERIIYGSFDQIIDRKGKLILCADNEIDIH